MLFSYSNVVFCAVRGELNRVGIEDFEEQEQLDILFPQIASVRSLPGGVEVYRRLNSPMALASLLEYDDDHTLRATLFFP